jgi:hypothetical protein
LNFNLGCETNEEFCIPSTQFCAKAGFDGKYYRRSINSKTKLTFDIQDLYGDDYVNPAPLSLELIHIAPLTFRKPFFLQDCNANVGNETCTSCDACNNGKGFKFNCTNIEVIGGITLPNVNGCIGLPAK